MAVQMPAEALGPAAGILLYSFFCLFFTLVLAWLVWVHNERKSYVLLLQFFICLHTVASIVQQINTIVNWNSGKTAQWWNIKENVGNPELIITGATTGMDLVLFYIQYYCYNVESMIVVCWAFELANSIFQVRFVKLHGFPYSIAAKATSIILPAISMMVLRFTPIQKSIPAFLFVSSGIMVFCFLLGAIALLSILVKYISSRFFLTSWEVRYGHNTGSSGAAAADGATATPVIARLKNIYDRWLMTRFSIGFIALALFQLVVVNFQLRAAGTSRANHIPAEPDLSASQAISDFVLFIPGVTAGLVTFLVFGTTRNLREYMWSSFAPKSWQEKREAKQEAKRHKSKPSVSIPDPNAISSVVAGDKPLPPSPTNDEEAQYDHRDRGVRMQNLGVGAWVEGGANAGTVGMRPGVCSPPPAHMKPSHYLSPGHKSPGMSDNASHRSEADYDFPIMTHSGRASSESMIVFLDKDSDLESQKGISTVGNHYTKETGWP